MIQEYLIDTDLFFKRYYNSNNMKKKLTLLASIIACTLLSLTSCEKHDGINYLKSKCTAELNGQTYIDQQPYTYIFGPTHPTPFLEYSQYEATFETYLSTERGGKIAVYCENQSVCGYTGRIFSPAANDRKDRYSRCRCPDFVSGLPPVLQGQQSVIRHSEWRSDRRGYFPNHSLQQDRRANLLH